MIHLSKDPEGETVLKPSSASDTHRTSKAMSTATVTDHSDEVAALKQEISKLEKKLAKVNFFFYMQSFILNIQG